MLRCGFNTSHLPISNPFSPYVHLLPSFHVPPKKAKTYPNHIKNTVGFSQFRENANFA